jgi:hypothetical protein
VEIPGSDSIPIFALVRFWGDKKEGSQYLILAESKTLIKSLLSKWRLNKQTKKERVKKFRSPVSKKIHVLKSKTKRTQIIKKSWI